jgi:hypothetical protein
LANDKDALKLLANVVLQHHEMRMRTPAFRPRSRSPLLWLRYHGIRLAIGAVFLGQLASAADIVARAETTELRLSDGQLQPRVSRDAMGHVTRLLLNDMKISQEEVAELGTLEYLSSLVLFRTNITVADLAHLKTCKNLAHLNLTSTEVTDRAIDTILEFKALKTVCLGNVNITPVSIEKLKQWNRTTDQGLKWGYSQRKR